MIIKETKDFEIEGNSTYFSTPIYKLDSKNELKGLLNKFKAVRILYDGKDAFAWQADMLDHYTIRKILGFDDNYFGFMIDGNDNNSIQQGWIKNNELVKKFKEKFM